MYSNFGTGRPGRAVPFGSITGLAGDGILGKLQLTLHLSEKKWEKCNFFSELALSLGWRPKKMRSGLDFGV
jgi:hypothetical protein